MRDERGDGKDEARKQRSDGKDRPIHSSRSCAGLPHEASRTRGISRHVRTDDASYLAEAEERWAHSTCAWRDPQVVGSRPKVAAFCYMPLANSVSCHLSNEIAGCKPKAEAARALLNEVLLV